MQHSQELAPSGTIEIHARRGERSVRVYAYPDGNARRLARHLTMSLLALRGEISLADDPDEGVFARPMALDGMHAFILEAHTRDETDLHALVICPSCSLGVSQASPLANRTWAELGYRAGDRLTLCVTGQRVVDMADTADMADATQMTEELSGANA